MDTMHFPVFQDTFFMINPDAIKMKLCINVPIETLPFIPPYIIL